MKALSIKQPWLWAITDLDKRVENRTWKPPHWAIGKRIALHASKADDKDGYLDIEEVVWNAAQTEALPRGAIVATARLAGWFHENGWQFIPEAGFDHLINSRWFVGPYGWILADVVNLSEPVPCRGSLGLWEVPKELLGRVER